MIQSSGFFDEKRKEEVLGYKRIVLENGDEWFGQINKKNQPHGEGEYWFSPNGLKKGKMEKRKCRNGKVIKRFINGEWVR